MCRSFFKRMFLIIGITLYPSTGNNGIYIKTCVKPTPGMECQITCNVPDFNKSIAIFHPSKTRIVFCEQKDVCRLSPHETGYVLKENRKMKQVSVLINHLDRLKHSGAWKCEYEGLPPKLVAINICDPPTFYISAVKGQMYTLSCNVDTQGEIYNVTWYKDENRILSSVKYSGVHTKVLTIYQIDRNDMGLYKCSVAVPEGTKYTLNGSFNNINMVQEIGEIDKNSTGLYLCSWKERGRRLSERNGSIINVYKVSSGDIIGQTENKANFQQLGIEIFLACVVTLILFILLAGKIWIKLKRLFLKAETTSYGTDYEMHATVPSDEDEDEDESKETAMLLRHPEKIRPDIVSKDRQISISTNLNRRIKELANLARKTVSIDEKIRRRRSYAEPPQGYKELDIILKCELPEKKSEEIYNMEIASENSIWISYRCDNELILLTSIAGKIFFTPVLIGELQINGLTFPKKGGEIWITTRNQQDGGNKVKIINRDGNLSDRYNLSTWSFTTCLHFSDSENLYVGVVMSEHYYDIKKNTAAAVLKFPKDETQQKEFQYKPEGGRLFTKPQKILENDDDKVWIIDKFNYGKSRLLVFDKNGKIESTFVGPENQGREHITSNQPSKFFCTDLKSAGGGRVLLSEFWPPYLHLLDRDCNVLKSVSFVQSLEYGSHTTAFSLGQNVLWLGSENGHIYKFDRPEELL